MHDINYSFNFALVKWPETTVAAEVDKQAYREKQFFLPIMFQADDVDLLLFHQVGSKRHVTNGDMPFKKSSCSF